MLASFLLRWDRSCSYFWDVVHYMALERIYYDLMYQVHMDMDIHAWRRSIRSAPAKLRIEQT